MKVFLDANVLVSIVNKEYPLYTSASRIISLADRRGFLFYTSPVCLAIAFYYSEKRSGAIVAKEKVRLLVQKMRVAAVNEMEVQNALAKKSIHDFEDGVEYFAALNENCQCIVTQNLSDFYFSEVEIATCEDFLEKYLIL